MDNQKIERPLQQLVSPLVKYDSKGNLFCVICKSIVKSSIIWKVHVNSKAHKQNVKQTKKVSKNIVEKLKKNGQRIEEPKTKFNFGKSIEKPSSIVYNNRKTVPDLNKIVCGVQGPSDALPETFFDDSTTEAKIHHVECKIVQNDEWERFQREMKEASKSSNELIYGEQSNSALNREITEISEQMYQWSKVLDLENKLKNIVKRKKSYNELDDTNENISDGEVDDHLNWRSKKFT